MTNSQEIAVIEEVAKFNGYKELIQDDIEDEDPSPDVCAHINGNLEEIKLQFLNVKVAQAKYKFKLVPSTISEEGFNADSSTYKYTDKWLETLRKEYKKLNKAASNFVRNQTADSGSNVEEKVHVTTSEDIRKLIAKITLEKQQVEVTISETYTNL